MASSKTPHVGLSQWSAEDGVKREDFNADNAIIDSYLHRMGNADILCGSYTGYNNSTSSGDSPVEVVLGRKPDAVLSMACGPFNGSNMPDMNYVYHILSTEATAKFLVLTDTGFTASGIMSQLGRSPFNYIAVFLSKEAE